MSAFLQRTPSKTTPRNKTRTPRRGTPRRGTPMKSSPYSKRQRPPQKRRNTRRTPSKRTPSRRKGLSNSNRKAIAVYGKKVSWASPDKLENIRIVSARKGRKTPFSKKHTPGFSTTPGSRANNQRKTKRRSEMAKKAAKEKSRKSRNPIKSNIKGKTLFFGGTKKRRRPRRTAKKRRRRRRKQRGQAAKGKCIVGGSGECYPPCDLPQTCTRSGSCE